MSYPRIAARTALATAAILAGVLALPATPAHASIIMTNDFVPIPSGLVGSGNGTLDMRMFTFSGSEIRNTSGTFDGDNGNNDLPKSSANGDTASFAQSYVTTAGELKAYYDLNFSTGAINEIMLLLDLSETTPTAQHNNLLTKLDIVLNPTSIQGDPDPLGDVSSDQQVAIQQVYTGGTRIAWLDPEPADNLPTIAQGAGFADYAIFTGIDPFSLDDSDVLLFNVSMSGLSGGAEEVFLSGRIAPGSIPEPATLSVLALGGLALIRRRRPA